MAVEFKVEYLDADNARVRAIDAEDGSLIDDARVGTRQAEALAYATLAARDAFRGAQADGLVEGARVLVGDDYVVRTEFHGQEGTITAEDWAGGSDMKVVRFDDGADQVVHNEYLTVVEDAEDADKAQYAAMVERLIEAGVRVRILDEPVVFGKGADEPDDGVFYNPGTVATITAWEDYADEAYCTERNFFLTAVDGGLEQVVAMQSTEPLDEYKEVIRDLTLSVGAEFAERRGIVPGATVYLPKTTLEGILFGTGRVLSVEGGLATVAIHDVTETYPAFNLDTAGDDG